MAPSFLTTHPPKNQQNSTISPTGPPGKIPLTLHQQFLFRNFCSNSGVWKSLGYLPIGYVGKFIEQLWPSYVWCQLLFWGKPVNHYTLGVLEHLLFGGIFLDPPKNIYQANTGNISVSGNSPGRHPGIIIYSLEKNNAQWTSPHHTRHFLLVTSSGWRVSLRDPEVFKRRWMESWPTQGSGIKNAHEFNHQELFFTLCLQSYLLRFGVSLVCFWGPGKYLPNQKQGVRLEA